MQNRCLTVLKPGESGKVVKLLGEGSIKRRLQDLGLVCGARVECLQKSPLGDPTAFSIKGAVIALREEDSFHVLIQ